MLSEDEMRRLTFIKYLYSLGVEQSRQAQPHASVAILTLHDGVELFLHLATEHHKVEVGKKTLDFADYFGRLEADPPGLRLTGKQSMLRLNQARVGLKHHANLPDEATITDLTGRVGIFFEDNTPVLFGTNYASISMSSLVQCTEAREGLETADRHLGNGDVAEAMKSVAIAFDQLLLDFRRKLPWQGQQSPFFVGRVKWWDKLGSITESIEAMQKALQIIALGIDYPRYAKFTFLTPHAMRTSTGEYFTGEPTNYHPIVEDYHFCFSFVVECALKLQEVDFGAAAERSTPSK